MPNFNDSTRQMITNLVLGLRVDRALATHSGATTAYFTVAGGKVLLTGLVGEITTASGANACSWQHTPTAGTAQPVSAALDINPALVGDALTITGLGNGAMTYNASATGLPMMDVKGVVLTPGSLQFISAAADGATKWSLFYVPLEEGAYVTAA
jgi:hypothetical protein